MTDRDRPTETDVLDGAAIVTVSFPASFTAASGGALQEAISRALAELTVVGMESGPGLIEIGLIHSEAEMRAALDRLAGVTHETTQAQTTGARAAHYGRPQESAPEPERFGTYL